MEATTRAPLTPGMFSLETLDPFVNGLNLVEEGPKSGQKWPTLRGKFRLRLSQEIATYVRPESSHCPSIDISLEGSNHLVLSLR